jgi:hypothetical protein
MPFQCKYLGNLSVSREPVPAWMVESASVANRDLAATQFPGNCVAIIFILVYSCWNCFQKKRFTKQPRFLDKPQFELSYSQRLRAAMSSALNSQLLRHMPRWNRLEWNDSHLMPRKLSTQLPKSNQCGDFRTWHFTSVLTPTREIHADIYWIATNNINVLQL